MINKKSEPDTQTVSDIVRKLRSIAIDSLGRMYRPEQQLFAFRLGKNGNSEVLEGVSRRYTATALIGLAGETQPIAKEVLGGHNREDVCDRLIQDIEKSQELGSIALTTWAARTLRHSRAHEAVAKLRKMDPASGKYSTVELSWALTALAIEGAKTTDMTLAERIADTLMGSFKQESGLFRRGPTGIGLSALRAHVSCFADIVYPIQALSYYHLATGSTKVIEAAIHCAERMCQLQGPEGQWWWHYDTRTGRIVERYPVYAVHQDSMAPMALLVLTKAGGRDYSESIEKGLRWLFNPPEISGALMDTERNIIWRKLARREPLKLVRGLQATASRFHSGFRVPAMDIIFPPSSVDYESRPYHMGWILHTWPVGTELS